MIKGLLALGLSERGLERARVDLKEELALLDVDAFAELDARDLAAACRNVCADRSGWTTD